MNKFKYFSILFLLLISTKSFAQYEGTFGMGAHAGYGSSIESVGAGVNLHYYYTNSVRFSPSFTYYVPRKGVSMWEVNADTHYIVPVSWLFSAYPIAGLHYSNRKFDGSKISGIGAQDETLNRVGANLGLGLQYDFRYKMRLNFEYKYQFIKDFSQSSFMLGIGFWI